MFRGAAFGDIDNDGDIDIVMANNNGPALLLLNEAASGRHRLQVRLRAEENRFAMGARVAVFRDGEPVLWRRARTDGSYMSASDIRVHFGLGRHSAARKVLVHWPGGRSESWENVPADRIIDLRQGEGRAE